MITIWHNPRCSKSRQTLALIEERDITIRKYLEDAPSADEIRAARDALGVAAIEMMRTKENLFKELGLSKTDADEVLIAAMADNPVLIERPIVFSDTKAAIGRPPEAVLDILPI
ncbi:Arsenate reductase [Thalassovita gelatinovora]|uniref:Arsenate reductase n=1 Tax=Thalassovita gelatinovora TaxID=53501 RepID=A0A0P1F7Q0_THAGE|nr:arsenate reductase (glutaredoxin) [Thalassovita gelatinovora]QIZ80162.1 arsenate reductase (glutaredoxin) [Thalassovita gelatinovora]CUH63964.1 Arsenate reductase [Thalassovita gelatinovora]SEQ80767.1 arsenate reductase [Thalassovita gelatinovora]